MSDEKSVASSQKLLEKDPKKTMPGIICWNCGADTGFEKRVIRLDNCKRCKSNLRSCRGCRFFDPTRRFQCRESVTQPVMPKDKSNFCDFFMVRLTGKAAQSGQDAKGDRKASFDDLFDD